MASWRVLDVATPRAPQLLVKSTFDASGYHIHLTDLSRMWAQILPRDDIVRRAADIGSSIDPGEDNEQLHIFFGKIESAVNREEGTSLYLRRGGGDEDTDLSLHISAPLPQPLPPFTWTVDFQALPIRHIQSELVTPLIHEASTLRHQIHSLVSELHERDRVISKITDRLETSGSDLTTVFPGVSNVKTSRKKSQREQLAKHVKGLADFDETAWREVQGGKRDLEGGLQLEGGLVNDVLRNLPLSRSGGAEVGGRPWWEFLEDGVPTGSGPHVSRMDSAHHDTNARRSVTSGMTVDEDESTRDDEFQTQCTPPHLKRHAPDVHDDHVLQKGIEHDIEYMNETHDESTTEDEDEDLDGGLHQPPPTSTQQLPTIRPTPNPTSASASPRKLGVIGRRSPRPAPSPAKSERRADAEVPESKPHAALGTIGGKAEAFARPTPAHKEEHQPSPPRRISQLGTLGGRGSRGPSPSTPAVARTGTPDLVREMSPRQSRVPTKEETPAARETSEERADRKRDQLKRELQEKAKAPMKKKRKF